MTAPGSGTAPRLDKGRWPSTSLQLAAGAISSVAGLLAALIALPLYLRYLGAEAFGVFGFAMAVQAAVLALDAGLAVSLTRRVAQSPDAQARRATAQLVHALSRGVWLVALAIGALLAAAAPAMAQHWLRLADFSTAQAAQALALAALATALRWPIAMYNGVLIGAGRIVAMAGLNVGVIVLVTAAAVAAAAWTADLRWVLGCLAAGALVQVLASTRLALQTVGPASAGRFSMLAGFMREAAAAGWLGVVGLLIQQQDKLALSWLLPASEFGYYVIASMIATSLYALVTPVFNMLYPQLAREATGDRRELELTYRSASLFLASLLFPLAAAMGVFGHTILQIWTGDTMAAQAGGPVVLLLALATALHGTMFMPYALKLSLGHSRLALHIALVLLLLAVPASWVGAWQWGAVGAAAGWLGVQVLYVAAGSTLTHARLLPGVGWRWLALDVAPPLFVSLLVAGLASAVSDHGTGAFGRLALAVLCPFACWAILGAASPRLRRALRRFFVRAD